MFTVDWSKAYNWWCLPVYLVARVLGQARVCKASGTLIVPDWQSAPFCQLLHPSIREFADFVTFIKELPLSEFFMLQRLSASTLFHGKMPNTKVLALSCIDS